jgi:hypothetical protein
MAINMPVGILSAILPLVLAACAAPPMRWERPGPGDAAREEQACRAAAKDEAERRLPYGNGPPIFGFHRQLSFLEWKTAIDNERSYLADDLAGACMRERGYHLVPAGT